MKYTSGSKIRGILTGPGVIYVRDKLNPEDSQIQYNIYDYI